MSEAVIGAPRWRRVVQDWRFRHLGALAIGVGLFYFFFALRPEWSPMHRYNRAFGDASLVMIALVMSLGPLSRLWRPWTAALPWRRELGIWGFVAAIVHTVIILFGWVELDFARLFGFQLHPQALVYVMVDKGFGFSNAVGILALVYGLVLSLTSNNRSQRWLGMPIWKFLQQGSYVLWALIVAHTAYFLYIHFLDFHRPPPPPNLMKWPFVWLVAAVLALQIAASWKTWRLQRGRRKPASA